MFQFAEGDEVRVVRDCPAFGEWMSITEGTVGVLGRRVTGRGEADLWELHVGLKMVLVLSTDVEPLVRNICQ